MKNYCTICDKILRTEKMRNFETTYDAYYTKYAYKLDNI